MPIRAKRSVALFTIGLVAVGFLIFVALSPREPVHEGRSLSSWLADLENPTNKWEAMEAIQLMGTNALPFIVEDLEFTEAKWQTDFKIWLSKKSWCPVSLSTAANRQCRAAIACSALGPLSKPAIASLKKQFHHKSGVAQYEAVAALGSIGVEGISILLDALEGPTDSYFSTVFDEPLLNTPVSEVPRLYRIYRSSTSSKYARMVAEIALRHLPKDEVRFDRDDLERFEDDLQHSHPGWRTDAAVRLGRLGKAAAPVIPALRIAVNDPHPQVRVEARIALLRIEPYATNKVAAAK